MTEPQLPSGPLNPATPPNPLNPNQPPVVPPLKSGANLTPQQAAALAKGLGASISELKGTTLPSGKAISSVINPFVELVESIQSGELQPEERAALSSVSQELYRNGLLSQVLQRAGDAILQFAEAKQIIQNAIQQQMGQDFSEEATALNPRVTVLSDNSTIMKIPIVAEFIANREVQKKATPLIVHSAIHSIKNYLKYDPKHIPSAMQHKALNLVSSLIALKVNSAETKEVQIVIPKQAKIAGASAQQLQELQSYVTEQLTSAEKEFTKLFSVADLNLLDVSLISTFKTAPQQALIILGNIPPKETGLILALLGIWVVNRQAVEAAILHIPYQALEERRNALKVGLSQPIATKLSEHRQRERDAKMALLDQLLQSSPTVANFLAILPLLQELEAMLSEEEAELGASIHKRLLYRAACEIVRVANSHPDFEYMDVGSIHPELGNLAQRIQPNLPRNVEELSAEDAVELQDQILTALTSLKKAQNAGFKEEMKRHPRLLHYLVHTQSPLVMDIPVHSLPHKVQPEQIKPIEQLLFKLSALQHFISYQPQVQRQLLVEASKALDSEVATSALKVVYKSIRETIASLDAIIAHPYWQALQEILCT